MKKGIGTPENIKKAHAIYLEHGGRNINKVIEDLKTRHSIDISKRTLYTWVHEGGWRADFAPESTGLNRTERSMKMKLLRMIDRYDRYMDSNDGIDNQTVYAYTNLIKAVVGLEKQAPEPPDLEEMRERGLEILEKDYGIKRSDVPEGYMREGW
jgi:hypothetical protein